MKRIIEITAIILLLISTGCNKEDFPVYVMTNKIVNEYGFKDYGNWYTEHCLTAYEWYEVNYGKPTRAQRKEFRKQIQNCDYAQEVIYLDFNSVTDEDYKIFYYVTFGGDILELLRTNGKYTSFDITINYDANGKSAISRYDRSNAILELAYGKPQRLTYKNK